MRTAGFVPAARSAGLIVTESAGELLVHDQERRTTHHLDPVTAAVWKSCDGWRTVADLGRSCACVLGVPISDDTAIATVVRLARAGLLGATALPTDSIGERRPDGRSRIWPLDDPMTEGAG